jgi:ABC-type transport system substrate-binding protein
LEVQATVIGKMLEQVGLQVIPESLDPVDYNRRAQLSHLEKTAEEQTWDIALIAWNFPANVLVLEPYHVFALGGYNDWVLEGPDLQRAYQDVLRTVDRDKQQGLIREMEYYTHKNAYFLFLYNPIKLYAVNKDVKYVPYVSTTLNLAETSVTDQHWSVRKKKAAVHE